MNRADLNTRARNVGIDPANYANDSKLEQRVLYEEKNNQTAAGTLATGTLTSDATNPSDGDTFTIGARTYTFKTALTEAKATQTLTSNATNPADGDTIAIGDRQYIFKTTLSSPAIPGEIKIGVDAATTLDNVKLAINGGSTAYPTAADASGAGSTWSTGTVRHEKVIATTNTNTTQVVEYYFPGVEGNKLSVGGTLGATLSWGATQLAGGVDPIQDQVKIGADAATTLDYVKDAVNATSVTAGPGTAYSTGTKANQDVTATTNTNTTQVFQAVSYNGGNTVATTENGSHTSFGAATLTGGVAKEVAQVAADNAAISGDARV